MGLKARVKATGNIVDVEWYGHDSMGTIYADVTHTTKYYEYELDFNTVYDYWTRLEHQYAGMALQGMLANANHYLWERKQNYKSLVANAAEVAHALVEKYKEEE